MFWIKKAKLRSLFPQLFGKIYQQNKTFSDFSFLAWNSWFFCFIFVCYLLSIFCWFFFVVHSILEFLERSFYCLQSCVVSFVINSDRSNSWCWFDHFVDCYGIKNYYHYSNNRTDKSVENHPWILHFRGHLDKVELVLHPFTSFTVFISSV